MITLRRAEDRRHVRGRKHEAWLTFYPQDGGKPPGDAFGFLRILNQYRLSPGAAIPAQLRQHGEVLTYVREGALVYQDSTGRSGIIQAGEFRCLTARRGLRHSETNASRSDSAQVLQIRVCPSEAGPESAPEQKRFSNAQRRGVLCVVASPDARSGSLRLHQNASIYSALLPPGQHVVHELTPGRSAWLHLVQGEATTAEVILTAGDGVGVTAAPAVSLTACGETEILLIDLGANSPDLLTTEPDDDGRVIASAGRRDPSRRGHGGREEGMTA